MMRLIVEYIQAICCSSDADADSTCMSVLDVDLVVVTCTLAVGLGRLEENDFSVVVLVGLVGTEAAFTHL